MKKKQKKTNPKAPAVADESAVTENSDHKEKTDTHLPDQTELKNIYAASAGNPGADDYQWDK